MKQQQWCKYKLTLSRKRNVFIPAVTHQRVNLHSKYDNVLCTLVIVVEIRIPRTRSMSLLLQANQGPVHSVDQEDALVCDKDLTSHTCMNVSKLLVQN